MRQFHILKARLSRFWSNTSGAISMTFGISSISLMVLAGVAVDYSRTYIVKQEISRALDAAVLAAGSMATATEQEMQEMAQRYFDSNLSTETKAKYDPKLSFNFDSASGLITASSSADVDTTLMQIIDYDSVEVRARSVAAQNLSNIEIALVLDNSGSMSGSKINSLKNAAKTLVDTMYEKDGSDEFVKISLVPFTGGVNVGPSNVSSSWLDTAGTSVAAQEDYEDTDTYWGNTTLTGMSPDEALVNFNATWKGCLRSRVGTVVGDGGTTVSLDVSDVPPTGDNPNTRWTKMVKPVSGNWYPYSPPEDWRVRNRIEDVRYTCPNATISPLSNDANVVKNAIDDMNAEGWTNIPNGFVWGWRVLSPGEPFTEGASYTQINSKKVIVVLTDGYNTVGSYSSNPINGYYSSFGMTAYGHLGTGFPGDELDEKLAEVCANAKSQGILVYSITFQLNDTNTQNLMRDCASQNDMYFNSPDNASLQDAFREIAVGLQKLRLVQ